MLGIKTILLCIAFAFLLQTCPRAETPSNPISPNSTTLEDEDSLALVKKLVQNIKMDKTNTSFEDMLFDKVLPQHTLDRHRPNDPYFYSNDRYVIRDIIDLILEDPDGFIDETATTGQLKIYRECVYRDEIEYMFDREKRTIRKVQNPLNDFQNNFLGQMIAGPSNKVMIILQVKGDEQNEATLEKRLAYFKNNVRYIDAYPVKDDPSSKTADSKKKEDKPENTAEEESKPEETNPKSTQLEEPSTKESSEEK